MKVKTWFNKEFGYSVLFFLLPLLVFAWTSIPLLAPYTLFLSLVFLLVAIGVGLATQGNMGPRMMSVRSVLMVMTVLLVVGATNWFFSPFFFLLYLVPLYLGFVRSTMVSFSFLVALLLMFSASVGEVDITYDFLILLSLLSVVPLVIFLRKRYLVIRQSKKDILILEKSPGGRRVDTISHLLSNRVTNLGVTIRQPITYIKQTAGLILEAETDSEEITKYVKRIRMAAVEAIELVKSFEDDTSANVVLRTKKKQEKKIKAP